jgi:hypothetical protein
VWLPLLWLAWGLALLSTPAWAGRPLDTEDTGTVEPGKVELQLSGTFARSPDDDTWLTKASVTLGLLKGLDVRIEVPVLWVERDGGRRHSGIGDTVAGVKYRLLDEGERWPAVLGTLVVRTPTGDEDRGLGEPGVDVALLAVLSKAFGPVTLTWNGGYAFVTDNRKQDVWILTAAAEWAVTKAWSLAGEVVSTLAQHAGPDTALVRTGTAYQIHERVKLDTGIGFGLTRGTRDVVITVGLTATLF